MKNLKVYSGIRHFLSNKGVKVTSSILAVSMLLSLAGCGDDKKEVIAETTSITQEENNKVYFEAGEHTVIIEELSDQEAVIYFHPDEVVNQEDSNEIFAPEGYEIEKIGYSGGLLGDNRWLIIYYRNLVPVTVEGKYDDVIKQVSYNTFGTIVPTQETTMTYQKTIN